MGTDKAASDQCVLDALNNTLAFHAVYVYQGFDSTPARGISSDADGRISIWDYDSSVIGAGDSGPSRVNQYACESFKIPADAANPGDSVNVGFAGESIIDKIQCIISPDAFYERVRAAAGEQAVDCGRVPIEQSTQLTDQCIADTFASSTAFSALFFVPAYDSTTGLPDLNGSTEAQAVSRDETGTLMFWRYSNSVAGPGDDGSAWIGSSICRKPEYTGRSDSSLDVTFSFQCSYI